MYWDFELEKSAQDYTRHCIWAHSRPMGLQTLPYSYGENLYVTSGTDLTEMNQAIDPWAAEHVDFNHDDLSCTNGKMCGHYTQVVWENSVRVGCAITECADVDGLSWGVSATLVACQYYAPGNWMGDKPYDYTDNIVAGECSEGEHGGSDSTDSVYTSLCNNKNEI